MQCVIGQTLYHSSTLGTTTRTQRRCARCHCRSTKTRQFRVHHVRPFPEHVNNSCQLTYIRFTEQYPITVTYFHFLRRRLRAPENFTTSIHINHLSTESNKKFAVSFFHMDGCKAAEVASTAAGSIPEGKSAVATRENPSSPEIQVDWALLGAECRRLGQSQSPIPTASIVFSLAVTNGESFFESRHYPKMVQLASVVARRFCHNPENDVRALIALMEWGETPYIGQVVFLRAILADPSVPVDLRTIRVLYEKARDLFNLFVVSRVYSAPQSLCPRWGSSKFATMKGLKENGCADEVMLAVLQGTFCQAASSFTKAAVDPCLFSSFARVIFGAPEFFKTLNLIYPNKEAMVQFLSDVVRDENYAFLEVFLQAIDGLPNDVVEIVASILENEGKPDRICKKIRIAPHLIPKFVRFTIDHQLYPWLVAMTPMYEFEVSRALVDVGTADPEAFCHVCEKCNSRIVNAVMAEIVSTKPLGSWSLPVIKLCLSKSDIWMVILRRDASCLIELVQSRPETAQVVCSLLSARQQGGVNEDVSTLVADHNLRQVLLEADPSAYWTILGAKERVRFRNDVLDSLVSDPFYPFPPLSLFEMFEGGEKGMEFWPSFFKENFDAVISKSQWIVPLTRVPSLFYNFIPVLRAKIPHADSRGHMNGLISYGMRLFQRFVEYFYSSLCTSYPHFLELASLLTHQDKTSPFRFDRLPMVVQLKIYTAFGNQCKKSNIGKDRGLLWAFLIQLSQNEKILEMTPYSARNKIFHKIICSQLGNRQLASNPESFWYLVWFLFEFCDDPFQHQRFSPNMLDFFLEMTVQNCDVLREKLMSKPKLRAKWVRSMINVPDARLGPLISVPQALSLLTNMMVLSLSEPEAHDFTRDRRFLELLYLYIGLMHEQHQSLLITRELLKVLTTHAAQGDDLSELYLSIFNACQELFMDQFVQAITHG